VEPNDASAFIVAMHRHDRENRADIVNLAKGAVLGMLFGAIGVGIGFVALIAYLQAASRSCPMGNLPGLRA
jgi:hypothetical protein